MKIQFTGRFLAVAAIASMLAACGGGGSHGIVPTSPGSSGGSSPNLPQANSKFVATIPLASGTTTSGKKAQYISAAGTSSLVVSVTPADPAEAAQWATLYGSAGFGVCYNIFNNGAAVTSNPNVIVTVSGSTASITFPFPSPPGQDAFVITQYAGACSSTNPYVAPTPGPGLTAATSIMSQSPALYVNINAGQANNFNVQLSACNTPVGGGPINQPTPVTCSVPNPPGTTTITPTLGSTVSFAYMAQSTPALPITLPATIPLPIAGPMREQGGFVTAANHVGLPIPIVGLDATGNAIPYTAPVAPSTVASSGLFPKAGDGLSITHTESGTGGNHFTLYLIDAKTGAIAQNTEPITLTQLNALNATDAKVGGTVGNPYVLVAAFDGSDATKSTSITVSMAGKINGASITTQTLTIKPQSALFTAVLTGPTTGYSDAAAPYTAAADILNLTGSTLAAPNNGYWVTDGANMHLVGTGTFAVAGATTLTGMAYDNNANLTAPRILAVDNSTAANAGSATPVAGGVFVFNPVTRTSNPLAIQNLTTGNYVALGKPQAIGFVSGGYVYAIAGNKIYAMDPQSDGAGGLAQITVSAVTYDIAEEIGTLPVTGLSGGTVSGFDMVVSGTKLIFPDPGNNRIVSVDTATCLIGGASCTPTVVASGAAFVGLAVNGTGYVATDTNGQIYTISSGGTVTSLGLSHAAAPKDGVVGVIGSSPLAPIPYTPQGQAANFFGSASVPSLPYNIAPFTAAGPVLAGAAQTAVAAGTLKFAADTSNGNFGTTAGATTKGFGVAFVSTAGANAALTSNSYLFADNGVLRTLVP